MNVLLETYRGAVYPWHCDHMGHMNVMWYTGKFDEATWSLFASLGFTQDWLKTNGRGLVALRQNTAYRREVHAGDVLTIRSGILEIGNKTCRFFHEMSCDARGVVAAFSVLTGMLIDRESRRGMPWPQDLGPQLHAIVRASMPEPGLA